VRRGTPVRSADGVKLGTVRRTQEAKREHIFDGIVIDTSKGKRFVDAPEVARIAERFRNTKTARRAKRLGQRARDSWDRR